MGDLLTNPQEPAAPVTPPVESGSETLLTEGMNLPAEPPVSEGNAPEATPFRDLLPEDLRSNETLARFNSVADLGKSYLELRKMQGNQVTFPGEGASQEEQDTFHKKLGWPETADKYELKASPDMPLQEGMVNWFRNTAHAIRLNQGQAEQMYNGYLTMLGEIQDETDTEIANGRRVAKDALNREWGSQAEANSLAVKQFAEGHFSKETLQDIEKSGIGDSSNFIRDLHAMFKKIGGGTLADAQGDPTTEPMADQRVLDTKKRLNEIYSDMNKYYQNSDMIEEATKLEDFLRQVASQV